MKYPRSFMGLLALVMLLGAVLACSVASETGVNSTPTSELPDQTLSPPAILATKTQPIGPDGGAIVLESGVRLVFPPDAVAQEMDVQVNQLDPARYLDDHSDGMLLDLRAPVTPFDKPIELHIPLPDWFTPNDIDAVVVGTIDETTGAIVYESAVVQVMGNKPELVVEADHFSWRIFKWLKAHYGAPPPQAGPLDIPYYSQGSTNYCWAASLFMVAEAGRHSQTRELFGLIGAVGVNEGGLGPFMATNYPSISGLISAHTGVYPERIYWPSDFLVGNNDRLITYIRRQVGVMGRPVALVSNAKEHSFVVVGYAGEDFYIHDPAGLTDDLYRRVSAADLGLDSYVWDKATIIVPMSLADDRPLITINIMDASLEFFKPKTNTPADTYQFRWDYTSPHGYSFKSRSNQTVAAIPGEVTQLRLVGNGLSIEIANAYRSGSAKDVAVSIDIIGKGPGKTHYAEQTTVSIEPGKVQRVNFNPIDVAAFRDPASTPTEYTFRVRALVAGQAVDDASFTFVMEPGGTPTPTTASAATPTLTSPATPTPTEKAACPSGSSGQATTKSDSFGDPADAFLSYTISGADFSQDPPGDFRFEGYYTGGPINLSGKMSVDRTGGTLSYVTMHAYLGDQSVDWPPPGEDSAVQGRAVSMPYNLTFNVPPDHDCSPITGGVRLEVCGGACGVYDVKFVISFAVPPTVTPGGPASTPTPPSGPTVTPTPTPTSTPTATPAPVSSPAPGTPHPATPHAGTVEEFFKVTSIHKVYNGATVPTTFTLGTSWWATEIRTYHWNNGQGATPGTITLVGDNGVIYGPWQASGEPGSGGVANAYWVIEPNVVLGPGTYIVADSDPDTWSQNDDTGGRGMAWGYGVRQN